MNKEDLLSKIEQHEKEGYPYFSESIFNLYFELIGIKPDPYIYDEVLFNKIIYHPKFNVEEITDFHIYIRNIIEIIRRLSISDYDKAVIQTNIKNILNFLMDNAKVTEQFKEDIIETLYDCLAYRMFEIADYFIYNYNHKIDINTPTKYGFPLIWEIIYLYLTNLSNISYKDKVFSYLDKIKYEFSNLDINNRGKKNYDIFYYLFNLKSGTTFHYSITEDTLIDLLKMLFNFPNFNKKSSSDKTIEKQILNKISSFSLRSKYKNFIYFLVTNMELDYSYRQEIEFGYKEYFDVNIFEYLIYLSFDPMGENKIYNETIEYILKNYKNKLSFSRLNYINFCSKQRSDNEIIERYTKNYNLIKQSKIDSLNKILDSIDESYSLNEEEEEELENVSYYADYYGTPGARELAHKLKENDPEAIYTIATKMANYIDSDDSIIPIPSRSGKATNTLQLANIISEITGAKVYDIIKGKSRESIYDVKKRGDSVSTIDFGYRLTAKPPRNPVLIDGVYATGTTLRSALNLIPNARIVVFAKSITQKL